MKNKWYLVGLFGVAMVASLQADNVKIKMNAQNCAQFATDFLAAHPHLALAQNEPKLKLYSFKNAAEFVQAINVVSLQRPQPTNAGVAAKVGAWGVGLSAVGSAALWGCCKWILYECERDCASLGSNGPLIAYVIMPSLLVAVPVLGASSYGLVKLSRRLNQTPLSRVVAVSNPQSLCKDVLMDPNVTNVLDVTQICELMMLLSKIK